VGVDHSHACRGRRGRKNTRGEVKAALVGGRAGKGRAAGSSSRRHLLDMPLASEMAKHKMHDLTML
jgi:hypothetical protein